MRRSCRGALGCLMVVALLLGGAAYWGWRRLTWHPTPAPPPAPARVAEARRQTANLERKIARLTPPPRRRPAAKGKPSSPPAPRPSVAFQLSLTEDELNAALQRGSEAAKGLGAFGIRDAAVTLKPGRATLNSYFRERDTEFYITLEGTPYLNRQRKIRLNIHDVRIGQIPAPAPLRRSLQFQLDLALRQLDKQIAARLDKVTVTRGRLLIEGHGAAEGERGKR